MFSTRTGHRFFPQAEPDACGSFHPNGLAIIISTLVVCWWALIEAALDFVLIDSDTALATSIATRLIVVVSGCAVVLESRIARTVFCFLCAMSVLALASAVALQFNEPLLRPAVCLVDSATKALFLGCAFISSTKSHARHWRNDILAFAPDLVSPRVRSADKTFRQTSFKGD